MRDVYFGIVLILALQKPFLALHSAGFDERSFYAITISIAHTGTYVFFNGSLALFDRLGIMDVYKIQRKKAEIPSKAMISKLYFEAVINHCITSPITASALFSIVK
jgi:predicted esterase